MLLGLDNLPAYEGFVVPKILYISPNGSDFLNDRFKRILESAARPETKIETLSFRPIDGNVTNTSMHIGDVIRAVIRAEKNEYDAVIIGCAADPGLLESKAAVNIPVVAPAEASMHVASMLGRFSAIVPIRQNEPEMKELAWRYGLAHMLASVKSVNVIRPENENEIGMKDPEKHRKIILDIFRKAMVETLPKVARSAVIEDHARSIILGCTFFGGWAKERAAISEELNILVMDPVIVSLKVAEMQVDNLSR